MPENRPFKRLARKTAADRREPYAAAAERLRSEPAYVPGSGFRPALAGFHSTATVSAQGPAGVAVVTRLLGSADRTEVDIDLRTDRDHEFDVSMRGSAVHVELLAGGWTATGGGASLHGRNRVQLRFTFPPVPPDYPRAAVEEDQDGSPAVRAQVWNPVPAARSQGSPRLEEPPRRASTHSCGWRLRRGSPGAWSGCPANSWASTRRNDCPPHIGSSGPSGPRTPWERWVPPLVEPDLPGGAQ
jgi:hypothetical protein